MELVQTLHITTVTPWKDSDVSITTSQFLVKFYIEGVYRKDIFYEPALIQRMLYRILTKYTTMSNKTFVSCEETTTQSSARMQCRNTIVSCLFVTQYWCNTSSNPPYTAAVVSPGLFSTAQKRKSDLFFYSAMQCFQFFGKIMSLLSITLRFDDHTIMFTF